MKLFKQKSSLLPNLKHININSEFQKTTRLSQIKLVKNKNSNLIEQNLLSLDEKEISEYGLIKEISKRCMSCKHINNDTKNISELKEEIELLKKQLNDEKLKSEVLREIAEEEKKKHILYKQKFQTIILSNGNFMQEIKNLKNTEKKAISYIQNKNNNKLIDNKIVSFKNSNVCNSVKNIKSSYSSLNSFLATPKYLIQTLPVNTKMDFIKNAILNKKLKIKNLKKVDEELIELKEKNFNKDKLIEELNEKLKELKEENNKLLNDKKNIEEDNSKLEEEIQFKNKEIEIIKLKLNEELDINQKYINKFKEIKDVNAQLINELQIEKEQNKKLRKKLNNKKEEINDKNDDFIKDKDSKRSLQVNGMKDMSNISCIEIKQQQYQYDPEDVTLNEIFQKRIFNTDETKSDVDNKK